MATRKGNFLANVDVKPPSIPSNIEKIYVSLKFQPFLSLENFFH